MAVIRDPKIDQRVFEIRPYTYTFKGVGAIGYELRDDRGRWLGVFDDIETARAHAAALGATVRLSWEPNANDDERVPA